MGKFAVFTVSGEEFALELDKIFEIIKSQKTVPLHDVPDYVNGVINFRGTVIPLIDLRKYLNVEPSSRKERIIITKMHGEKIGLLVDSVKEIVSIEERQIARAPSIFKGLKPEYIKGIGKIIKRLIIILNLDNLLTSEEVMLITKESSKT